MIVFIDDEHGPMDFYVEALRRSGFEVQHLDTVSDALQHIEEASTPADLYVLDLMMPPGDVLDLETAGYGLTSGIEIYRRLRAKYPPVPIIILTSVSTPAILDALPVDENTDREAKIDILPFEFVEKVKGMLHDRN